MSANLYVIEDYENETASGSRRNKPNSNPIQTQSSLAQKMRFAILERRMVIGYLSRHWQTKPKVSYELT